MTTEASAVSVRAVGMTFGDVRAVVDASFELARGRFLTILGPSGSGKTTLLRLIAGFERPTSGEILLSGHPVQAVPPHRRRIGMVFQRLALFPHLTAAENVAFPLRMRRFDARTIPDRVERMLAIVRLPGLGDRRIHELSGGQQQRVAIARALVFEPDLLLLDEPLAALDRKLREEMQLEFRRIQRELGVTTINVTHDQREALVMSDEIVVMDHGRIQQTADPATTYRLPANRFVAGFIGVTNFLPQGDGDAALRAEQIRIAGKPSTLDALETVHMAKVTDRIFEGERTVYEVVVPALAGQMLRIIDHDPASHATHAVGSEVAIGWNARDLTIFGRQRPAQP
ncbi:MAG: ABC transporter ATP-binding protein [Geminicoccaceae bacterium]